MTALAALSIAGCGAQAVVRRLPAIFHLATDGDDANPGSEARPFRTLERAVRALEAGDTLHVRTGVYAEALIHTIPTGESENRPVRIAAAPGHRVVLRPQPGAESVLRFKESQAYIVIDGLELDGSEVVYDVVKITGGAHHIRIRNCVVRGSRTGHGIVVSGNGDSFVEVLGSTIRDNGNEEDGGTPNHGIYIQTDRNLVEGNDIFGHRRGYGIHLFNGSHSYNVFRRNRVHDNGDGILANGWQNQVSSNLIWNTGWGITVNTGLGTLVAHNTIDRVVTGVGIGRGAFWTYVRNNMVQGSQWPPDDSIINLGVRSVIEHNLVDRGVSDEGIATVVSNNRRGDTRFLDRARFDFRLGADSDARGVGVPLPEVSTDFEGQPWGEPRSAGAFR